MEERARSRRAEVTEDWREGDGENEVSGEGISWMGDSSSSVRGTGAGHRRLRRSSQQTTAGPGKSGKRTGRARRDLRRWVREGGTGGDRRGKRRRGGEERKRGEEGRERTRKDRGWAPQVEEEQSANDRRLREKQARELGERGETCADG